MKIQYANWVKIRKIALFTLLFTLSVLYQKSMGQNVGITDAASISPNYLLQVHKNAASGAIFQLTNTSTLATGSDGFILDIDASLGVMFKNQEAGLMSFYTSNTARMTIASAGTVGINATPSANYQLYVTNASTTADNATIFGEATGNAKTYGVYGSTTSTTTNGSGVYGAATGASGAVNGVWGYASNSSSGSGVYGLGASGVYGSTNFTGGIGVYGYTNATSLASVGVSGETASTTGTAVDGWNTAVASTAIGFGGFFSNNQTGGCGVAASLGVTSYFAGAAVSGVTVNTLASGKGVIGACDNATGVGVQGQTSGATGYGVRGINSSAGATVGFGGFFYSLATSGAGVAGSLGSASYFTGAGVSGFTVNTIAGGVGVIGDCSNATGTGVQGQTSGATGNGVIGLHSGTGAGNGVSGQTTSTTGTAIDAYNTAASGAAIGFGLTSLSNQTGGAAIAGSLGTGVTLSYVSKTAVSGITASTVAAGTGVYGACDNATGYGVYGKTAGATGYGVYGSNTNAAGIGVLGVGNNQVASIYLAPGSAGAGGNFVGSRYGIYSTANTTTAGAGYSFGNTYAGVLADATAASANSYHFGVHGAVFGAFTRSGGVLGSHSGYAGVWGALGYRGSAPASYGVYGSAAYASGAGKVLQNFDNNGIGGGFYGGILGGWVRGDVYGFVAKGSRYSLYVDGKTYTNNIIAQVSEGNNSSLSKGGNKKIVSYVTTSTTVDIYSKGTAELSNGSLIVTFEENFKNLISSKIPVVITVSPMGECNGVYVTNITENGFTVKELNGGNSNVKFSWIAIGTKFGYESPENPAEIIESSYDANMNGVMFNENNTTDSATPIWWDGSKLRFDKQPEQGSNGKTEKSENLGVKTVQFIQINKIDSEQPATDKKSSNILNLDEPKFEKSKNLLKSDLNIKGEKNSSTEIK